MIKLSLVILRLILASLFLWSGMAKMLKPVDFILTIDAFGIVPTHLLDLTALSIILIELIIGIGLIVNNNISRKLSLVLMLVFMIVLTYGIFKNIGVDCGCFGNEVSEASSVESLKNALLRDFFILAGLLFLNWKSTVNV